MTLLTLALGSSLVKTDYEAECLALPKGRSQAGLSFMPRPLTDTWPNSFTIPTASMACLNLSYMRCSSCSARRRRRDTRELVALFSRVSPNPCEQNKRVSAKRASIGRSSDNRRFCSPNYSAWRRSRTESLLSNARYFINSPPCARFARALGAPRTAHYATPPLGAGAVWLMSSWCRLRLQ
jgi:hypothetical protein